MTSSELSQASSVQPCRRRPGGAGQSAQVELLRDLQRGIGPSVPQVPRAKVICDRPSPQVRTAKGYCGSGHSQSTTPKARRGGSDLMVRWPSAQPWHGPRPRGLGVETLSSSRGGPPTRVRAKRDEVAAGFRLLCPGTLSPFVSPALGHALGLQREASLRPPGAGAHRAEPADRVGPRSRASTPNAWGRRGQTPGWKKREGQERAKLPGLRTPQGGGSW